MIKNLFILVVLIAVLAGATFLLDQKKPPGIDQKTGLPVFSFTTLDGKTHSSADFKGKIVMVNLWATWCAPCVKEFPQLLEVARKKPDSVLIALSSDVQKPAVERFLKQSKFVPLPPNVYIAMDEQDVTASVFKVLRLPETIIFDTEGHQTQRLIGANWQAEGVLKNLNSM